MGLKRRMRSHEQAEPELSKFHAVPLPIIRRDPNTVGCSFKTREFKDERYACRFGRDHRQRGSGVAYN